jgi:hypothetical protein
MCNRSRRGWLMPYAIVEEDRRFVEEFRRQPIGKHSP